MIGHDKAVRADDHPGTEAAGRPLLDLGQMVAEELPEERIVHSGNLPVVHRDRAGPALHGDLDDAGRDPAHHVGIAGRIVPAAGHGLVVVPDGDRGGVFLRAVHGREDAAEREHGGELDRAAKAGGGGEEVFHGGARIPPADGGSLSRRLQSG